jgi:sigma-B regulation protein RsbU (phosphoserine phosphatase)
MPMLRVRFADGVRTFPLSSRPLMVGRQETCDIVLRNDAEVSREHAQIWLDPSGAVVVVDVDSKNGTRVDDGESQRGGRQIARNNIRIGEYVLEVVDSEDAPAGDVRFTPGTDLELSHTRFFPSTRRPDLSNQQRLGLLMELTERIGGVFEKSQLLEQALDACMEALGFERGLLVLRGHRGEPEQPVTRNVQRDETGAIKISRTLINRALVDGERAVVNNPATDLINNMSESLVRFPIRSALCVPIVHRDEILGAIYGDRVTRAMTYTSDDVDFLAAIAQQVGVGLSNLRLLEEHVRSQRVYAALQQARTIQQKLLPSTALRLERLWIDGYNQPSASVSGDYFDFFPVDDEHVAFVIADVTGHGLPAALLMANFQAAVRVGLTADAELADLAARLNRHVHNNTSSGVFVTGLLGRISRKTGNFEYICAGHPPPVLVGPEGPYIPADHNENCSLPFGVLADDDYYTYRYEATRGVHAVLLYTDGLSEAANAEGKLLGVEKLVHEFRALRSYAPSTMLSSALALVRSHIGRSSAHMDDLTLLALQYQAE